MSGTQTGGYKAAAKNKAHDPLHYIKIGRAGGFKSRGGGFAKNRALAVESGRKGGFASRKATIGTATVECPSCFHLYKNKASLNSHKVRYHGVKV